MAKRKGVEAQTHVSNTTVTLNPTASMPEVDSIKQTIEVPQLPLQR